MAQMGLGVDSYMRMQKQISYGVEIESAMTLIPIKEGSFFKAMVANIEQANCISSRLKQAPELGRKMVSGQVIMDAHPSLIGIILNNFLGAADGVVDNSDTSFSHNWIQALTGDTDAIPFTIRHAQGVELEDGFIGMIISKLLIEVDTEGNVQLTADYTGKDFSTDNARITSFSYPALIPFKFSQLSVVEDGLGDISDNVKSFSVEIDMNYDLERFKIGDDTTKIPVFAGIPIITMNLEIDADQQFIDAARLHNAFDFTCSFLSTENAGTTPTKFQLEIELPECRLNPDTFSEHTNERISGELEFDCSYGGISTNSGSDPVQFEIRLNDKTASYTV